MAISEAQVLALEWQRQSLRMRHAEEQRRRAQAAQQQAWDRAHTPALYQLGAVEPGATIEVPLTYRQYPTRPFDRPRDYGDITRSTAPWWRSAAPEEQQQTNAAMWQQIRELWGDPLLPPEILVSKGL